MNPFWRLTTVFAIVLLFISQSFSQSPFSPDVSTYYNIVSKEKPNQIIDIYGSARAKLSNVAFYSPNKAEGTANQQFRFRSTGDGYYHIISAMDHKIVLDVHNAWVSDGNNIQTHHFNETNKAQKFKLINAGNGYIEIISALDENVYLGMANDGWNLVVRNGRKGNKTVFSLRPTSKEVAIPFNKNLTKEWILDLFQRDPFHRYRGWVAASNRRDGYYFWSMVATNSSNVYNLKYKHLTMGIDGPSGQYQLASQYPKDLTKGNQQFRFTDTGGGKIKITSIASDGLQKHLALNPSNNLIQEVAGPFNKETMLFELYTIEDLPQGVIPAPPEPTEPEQTVLLFPDTYIVPRGRPVYHLQLRQLKCINTQDNGEDEIVLELKIDGKEKRIPGSGSRDMNEESDIAIWEINETIKFTKKVELLIREMDNSEHEEIGTMVIDTLGAQGVLSKSFKGPNDSHYRLTYAMVKGEIGDLPVLTSMYFEEAFIRDTFKSAAINGGDEINKAIEAQEEYMERVRKMIKDNKYRLEKLEETSVALALDVGMSAVPIIVTGTASYLLIAGASTGTVWVRWLQQLYCQSYIRKQMVC